ncbi:hypothetical protein [Ottowia testudinis]|uniref:Uncharacterized protein n=1 Tax=Ottowia testudinis TaxID=2816950 RepID=A0A975CC99_9BURK|nr:hypothetical protein [Ottowia testudinis]QTD43745.1 hypothetical protein J1M35_11290 [Ottowia testudinis]
MHLNLTTSAAVLGALLLTGCVGTYSPYSMPPGDSRVDAVQTHRGQPLSRVILREGPVVNSETALSPEDSARQEAIQYCSGAGLDLRVLDVRKERMPARVGTRGGTVDYERVRLTFACEKGQP